MQSVHTQSEVAVLQCFSDRQKEAKKQKRTGCDNGKASNARQRSLKELFAAPGPKFTQAIYESKVCNKITISRKQTE